MPIIYMSDITEDIMNELNQNLAENLGDFLLSLSDEVVKGLQNCLNA